MAVIEEKGRMTYKDTNGDLHRLYPVTKKECVEGIDDFLTMPESSSVGQHLEVEAVDDDGKITRLKAVDKKDIPTPTESDYNKYLSCNADGFFWADKPEGENLADAEEGSF